MHLIVDIDMNASDMVFKESNSMIKFIKSIKQRSLRKWVAQQKYLSAKDETGGSFEQFDRSRL